MIDLAPIPYAQKAVLRNLMELCQHDYSEYNEANVDEHGLFGYRYLDHYWTEERRHPLFIRVAGHLAGFALVRQTDEAVYEMAEFFILRKYRRQGIGRDAAHRIFARFPGRWQVAQEACNLPAQAFWRTVIAAYTGGQYTETTRQVNARWQGPMQEFITQQGDDDDGMD